MSCPDLFPGSITLSEQAPSREVLYDFTYDCRRQADKIHNWWTSATDWLEVDPSQGFGFDSQTFAIIVSLGDTSSLSPGVYGEWVAFGDDWFCGGPARLWVNCSISRPSPTPSTEYFRLTDLENLRVTHPRGHLPYNLVYRLRDTSGAIVWGHTYDRENRYYDGVDGAGNVIVEAFAHSGYGPRGGDDLRLTYDGGQDFHIYLPAFFTGYIETRAMSPKTAQPIMILI